MMFNDPMKRKEIKCPACGEVRYYWKGSVFKCHYCGEVFDIKGKIINTRVA